MDEPTASRQKGTDETVSIQADRPTSLGTLDKRGEKIKAMFAGIAPKYDLLNHALSLNIDKRWRAFTVKKLAPKPGDSILDTCTGTGDLALGLFDATGRSGEVVGADFTPQMLDIARTKAAKTGKTSIRWIEADSQNLPFEDDRFDLVTVAFGIRNVADPYLGLRELLRVCKPGGKVGILEFSKPRVQPFRGLYMAYFKHVLPRIGQTVSNSKDDAYNYLPASVLEFPDGQAMLDLMRREGFVDVEQFPLTFGIATLYLGRKPIVESVKSQEPTTS